MSDDLIQRLRNAAITGLDPSPFDTLTHEAAAEIERLRFDREHLLAVHAQDQEEIKRLRAAEPLSDAQIVELRDQHLPSQGEGFDCIAFARAVIAAHEATP